MSTSEMPEQAGNFSYQQPDPTSHMYAETVVVTAAVALQRRVGRVTMTGNNPVDNSQALEANITTNLPEQVSPADAHHQAIGRLIRRQYAGTQVRITVEGVNERSRGRSALKLHANPADRPELLDEYIADLTGWRKEPKPDLRPNCGLMISMGAVKDSSKQPNGVSLLRRFCRLRIKASSAGQQAKKHLQRVPTPMAHAVYCP